MDVFAVQELKVTTSRITQGILLGGTNGLDRATEVGAGAGADFDEDEDVAVTADQVEFAAGGPIVTCKYTVPVLP